MNKKRYIKLPAIFLICVLLCAFATSCSNSPEAETYDPEIESEEVFVPAKDDKEEDELFKRYGEYAENALLAFADNEPLSTDKFKYEATDGKIKITEYIGEDGIVVIPEKIDGLEVSEIGEAVFSGGAVRAVYIPDSVKKISKSAFSDCSGLSTLRVPFIGDGDTNAYFGYIFGASEVGENAIKIPQSLDMVIIGEGCQNIEDEAFRGSKTLSAVVFEGDISNIGNMAFYQCSDLVYINLEKVSGNIGQYALSYCSSLWFADISRAKSVERGAFYSCSKINGMKLILEDGDYLGRYFGAESAEYNDEFVSSSLRQIIIAEGCNNVPDRALTSCKYVTDIILPTSLESIGVRSFYACRSLSEIVIPDSVKMIDDDAFFGCDNLVSVKLGNKLETIGMQSFFGCESLEGIEFPDTLKKIGSSAFYGCLSLKKADLEDNVELGKDVFEKCPALKKDSSETESTKK